MDNTIDKRIEHIKNRQEELNKKQGHRRQSAGFAAATLAATGIALLSVGTNAYAQTIPEKAKDNQSATATQNNDMARFNKLVEAFQNKSNVSVEREFDNEYAHVKEWGNPQATVLLADRNDGIQSYQVISFYPTTDENGNLGYKVAHFNVIDGVAYNHDCSERLSSREFNEKMTQFATMHTLEENQQDKTITLVTFANSNGGIGA